MLSMWIRLALLGGVLVSLFVVAKACHITDRFTSEGIINAVNRAGMWGPLIFQMMFILGELLHFPGLLFVGGAVFLWGRWFGGLLGICSSLVAVSVAFMVSRVVGGSVLDAIQNKFVRRILEKVQQHPIFAVAVLRLLTILHPGMNNLLAFTSISFLNFFVGSALGLFTPLVIFIYLFDWIRKQNIETIVSYAVPILIVNISVAICVWWCCTGATEDDDEKESTVPEKDNVYLAITETFDGARHYSSNP